MHEHLLEEMKKDIGFCDDDATNIHALAEPLTSDLPAIADRFSDMLRTSALADRVFRGGNEQLLRLRDSVHSWLQELFSGEYDVEYFHRHSRVGVVHVHVGLPQHKMVTAMEVIKSDLERCIYGKKIPNAREKVCSLEKLLTLELATLVDSYVEHFSEHVRDDEREAMEEQLTQSEHMARIGSLAASLAHAIKNPLAGISGAIQVIGGALPANDPHKPVIDEMLDQIGRLDATVRDLLVYSRPKALTRTSLDLNDVIARVLSLLREEPTIRRIKVEHIQKSPLPLILGDERQLEQVVMNLLLNAADASSEGDRIEISTTYGACIVMEITDSGMGMDSQVLKRAFEPFYTTKTKGTGLGLAISRQIVNAHGGKISIQSSGRSGTTVTVEIPVHRAIPDVKPMAEFR